VDSMLVINNEKLYEFPGEKLIQDAFPKADEVLATAVRGITEIITRRGFINVDLQDVMTMMRNSGMALMGIGTGTGENRIQDAVKGALESPLMNDFDLKTAKYVLAIITVGRNAQGVVMNELNDINQMINEYTGDANNFKRGIIYDDDPAFGDRVNITAIAVGFKMADLSRIANVNLGNIILIEPDFTYTPGETPALEEEGEGGYFRTIGFNTAENVRKFHYKENEKPVLLAGLNGSRAELETTPAIRRRPGSQTTKTE
jgi:cell division protein FtsZ